MGEKKEEIVKESSFWGTQVQYFHWTWLCEVGSGFCALKSQGWDPVRFPHALSSGHNLWPLALGWLLEALKVEELDRNLEAPKC